MLRTKIIVAFILLSFYTFAQNADKVIGKYHLPNKLDVEIFKHKSKYFGRIIALNNYQEGQTIDYKNPKKEHRSDKLLGKIIITNLEYNEKLNQWVNGKMYGPEKGIFFNLKIKDVRKAEIEIEASKYLFWKTINWKRI